MSTVTGIGIFVGGPLLGALSALLLGFAKPWQVILGAVLGEGIAWMVIRAWSEHASARTLRSGGVVIRATGLGWQDHLVTATVLVGFAVLIGGLVALVGRLFPAGQ
jgi:hypothetical protein